ncbi:MAG: HRDC domain-containing protein, partial [Thermoguttaceae bacterium]|nr:HRDC domain-containing protein [Thermoguttaceae bacterium]
GRFSWFEEETRQMLNSIVSVSPDERWRNMAGINRFSRRELAIVRELWNWREARAIEKNQPFNRIIRDDLLLELAKRKSADPHRIVAIRGMNGHHFSGSFLVELGNRIRYALSLSDNDLPPYSITRAYPQYTAAVQFFMMILGQFANKKNIPIKLLASSQDVRNFIAWTEGTLPDGVTCRLLDGWRAELAGELLKNLLNGQIGVSLSRNLEENPLRLIICKRHKKV